MKDYTELKQNLRKLFRTSSHDESAAADAIEALTKGGMIAAAGDGT